MLLGAACAFGELVIKFGIDNNAGGMIPGNKWAKTDAAFSKRMTQVSEASSYTTGTFSALPSGHSGSGVTFDVVVTSSCDKVKAQPKGIGVSSASSDAAIDDGEWITVSVQNVAGIDPLKETLQIKSVGLKFTSRDESYILNDGEEVSFSGTKDVLSINSGMFKLQEGTSTDSKFIMSKITFEVVPLTDSTTDGMTTVQ